MKLTIVLLTAAMLSVQASGISQTVTLSGTDIPVKKVFAIVEQQTGYVAFYNKELLEKARPVSLSVRNMPLSEFLSLAFKDQPFNYELANKTIILVQKPVRPTIIFNRIAAEEEEVPQANLTGTVLDIDNKPIPGATIMIKGSRKATSAGADGHFSLPGLEDNATLVVSAIGYETLTIPLKAGAFAVPYPKGHVRNDDNQLYKEVQVLKTANNYIVIRLERSDSQLDQVQITAYGQTTRRLSTGSITTVKSDEIARNPVPNVLEVLQGRVPGMFVQQQSGQPGTPFSVQIRGKSSLSTTNPLIIVDGVAYPNGDLPFIYLLQNTPNILRGGNIFDYLNPELIEQVDVLKGADATSVYGSRGAYGVILITTKKGRAGKPQLNVNYKTGFQVRGTSADVLNIDQYLMLRREAFKNDNATPAATDYDVNGTWPEDRDIDWQGELTGAHALMNRVDVAFSGGSNNVNYRIGASYNTQQSVQRHAGGVKDGGLNFNVNASTNDQKFTIGISGFYSSRNNSILPIDFTNNNGYNLLPPNAPDLFLPDGSINWSPEATAATGGSTSLVSAFELISKNVTNNLTSNTRLVYKPVKGLSIEALIGFNTISGKQLYAQPSAYFNPATNFVTTSNLDIYNIRTWTLDPNISYSLHLGYKGTLTAKTGATIMDRLSYNQTTSGSDFISDAMLNNPTFAPAANITTNYNQTPNRYLGYFGILHYDWDHKYLLNLNGRYDGSTRFGHDKQFGAFGSVGAAWIFSEERWFQGLLPVISFAKIRASYGTEGGDNIADYLFLNTYYNGTSYQGNPSLAPNSLANPDLHWEHKLEREVAMNLEFLRGRISTEVTYYNNRTSDQLLAQPLPTTTGYAYVVKNSPGLISNHGWEIVLNTVNIKSRDFSWSTSFNVSTPRSILKAYPAGDILTNLNYVVGKSVEGIKLYKYAGVNPETGNYNFYKNGEIGEWTLFSGGQLDQVKDRTEFVDLAPKYYGGFQNTFRYKGFTLDFLFTFTNRMGKNFLGSQTFPYGFANQNMPTVALDRWQKKGDITEVPKITQSIYAYFSQANFVFSTGAYSRATYARLSNLSLYYTFTGAWLKKAHLNNLNVFAQGQNLLTISQYKDLDPENLGAGLAPMRTFTAGINVTL